MSMEAKPALKVIEQGERMTWVALEGRLDTQGVDDVETAFSAHTAAHRRPTVVDLSSVQFLASLGIGMIVRVARTLRRHDAGLVLLAPQETVERTLRAARIESFAPIARDRDEALSLLKL